MRLIFHIDVNSAFLSWSAIEKLKASPELDLRTIPAIIGGDERTRHGVVLAKSIPAKRYGVQTGEPVANALRKCPFLVMEPPDHRLYRRRSHELMELLHSYTPDIEQLSIDECFLDYTPISHRFPSPESAARTIADRVRDTLGFTVNIGIAPNRLLAKMASDFEKPDKVHTLYPEEIPQKMWPLSVRDLYMVGKRSAARLEELGIRTIGELAHCDPACLQSHFKSHGRTMWEYANGISSDVLQLEDQDAKCIGNSTTLGADATSAPAAKHVLLELAEEVSGRLRRAHLLAGSVTVELKYNNFRSCSRQTQLSTPLSATDALYTCACRLFDELWNGTPIRLLGIRTAKLQSEDAPVQLSLFDGDYLLQLSSAQDSAHASGPVSHAPGQTSRAAKPASHTSEPTSRAAEPTSHASEPTSRAAKPASYASESTSRFPERSFGSSAQQPYYPAASLERQRRLDAAMDQIRQRYGDSAIIKGAFLQKKER